MAAAASGLTPKRFLVMGHGLEYPIMYDERRRLPEGYTLVIMSECGVITQADTVYPFLEAFGSEEPAIQEGLATANPTILNEIQDGKTVHILTAGMPYPALIAQMFLDFNSDENTKHPSLFAMKSGLYEGPINLLDWKLRPGINLSTNPYAEYGKPFEINTKLLKNFTSSRILKDKSILNLYKGSLFPTPEQAEVIFDNQKGNVDKLIKAFRFPIETLFATGGPGVYYWPICRHIEHHMAIDDFAMEIDNAINEARGNEYRKYQLPVNWVNHANNLSKMIDEDLAKDVPFWFRPTLEQMKKQFAVNAPAIVIAREYSGKAANQTKKPNTEETGRTTPVSLGGGRRKTRRRQKNNRRSLRKVLHKRK